MMRFKSIGSLLAAGLVWVVAGAGGCGGENKSSNPGGAAGAGGSGGASASGGTAGTAGGKGDASVGSKMCGTESCDPVTIPFPGAPAIPACCPPDTENTCGLDSTLIGALGPMFAEPCQPLDQPGTLDPDCPSTEEVMVPDAGIAVQFPGCCRPNGQCGYLVDEARISILPPIALGLGCVDAAPFLEGGAPQSCGSGSGGAGGEAGTPGAGGAAGDTSAGGAAGDPGAAGMGGA